MSFPKKALKDICTIQIGKTPSRHENDYWREGIHPWLSIADMNQGRVISKTKECITDLGVKASNIKLTPKNTVVLSYKLSIGKVGITQKPMYTNEAIAALIELKPEVDINYFYWVLQHIDLLEYADRAAMGKTLNKAKLSEVKIPLPPLSKQRRIASILDKADELRQKRQQAIEKLDQLLQATFIDMFGDPVLNTKKWPSDLKLGDIADIASGITKGRKVTGKILQEIPYLAVSNVQDKYLNLKNIKTIEATAEEISRYKLQQGDLLLTEGGDPDKLGRGTLWNNEIPECIHQNHVFRVRITSKNFTPNYLNWIVSSDYGKRYFLKSAKQTTGIASINMGQLKRLPLLTPPIALQVKFDHKCEKISQLKKLLEKSNIEVDNLFKSLQNKAFSGNL